METSDDKGRTRDVWGEQNRENQRFGDSNSQTKLNEASRTVGNQPGRIARESRQRTVPIVPGQPAEATDGGIISQLIENLQSQRAFHQQQIESHQQQIQSIDEEIAGLEGLSANLETDSSEEE